MYEKILYKYLKNNKIYLWPKRKESKHILFAYLVKKFETGRKYTEKEVNEILQEHISILNVAFWRRALYDSYYLNRTRNGRKYWREK